MELQPIEQAPKDGSKVLLYYSVHDVFSVGYYDGDWVSDFSQSIDEIELYPPEWWAPLPEKKPSQRF